MAIPTYWGRAEGWRVGDEVYDHPTPLGQAGTLGRTLASLERLVDLDFELVVVVVPTHPSITPSVTERAARLCAGAPVPTHLFTPHSVARLHDHLAIAGRGALASLVSLNGYGPVRNACLIAGQLLAADAVLMIDDDEVINDPQLITRVRAGLARGIHGLAGYYVNAGGDYLLGGATPAWEAPWGKREAMNRGFREIIGRPPRYQRTPFVFGGNATIARPLFTSVPFDPRVPRGEDIDYLINAHLFGHEFILDNELAITHLPPPHSAPAWQQLRQDAFRFAYERDKLSGAGVAASVFDPYPGPVLGADLGERLAQTCRGLAEEYRRRNEPSAAEQTERLAREVSSATFPDAFGELQALRERWQQLMAVLADEMDPMRFLGSPG